MKFYYFSAEWCSPCKAMKPMVKEYDNVEFVDVDTDEGSKLAGQYAVRGIPTLVAVDANGAQQDVLVGAVPQSQLSKFMEKNT